MKCVSYNIQYGLGMDGRYDLERIAAEVADADVIAMQEVDRFWQRSGMRDAPAVLADCLPGHHYVYGANLDMDASVTEAGRILHRRKQFGTLILLRWPIISSRNFPLPKFGDRRHHSVQQGMLEAVIDAPGIGPVRIYSVHLSHLSPAIRLPQVARMREILTAAPSEGGAWCGGHPDPSSGWLEEPEPPMPTRWILMGDMNFLPVSAEYDAMVGGMAPRYGRLTNRMGPLDAWVLAGHDETSGVTYHGGDGRIDHCFVSGDMAGLVRSARIDDTAQGSDHWPLWVEFGAP